MIPVATTHSAKISYVEEVEREAGVEFPGVRKAEVVIRDWDVNDPEARAIAAEEQLGEGADDDEWYSQHAMWFVDASRNSAVLVVFRPKDAEVIVR